MRLILLLLIASASQLSIAQSKLSRSEELLDSAREVYRSGNLTQSLELVDQSLALKESANGFYLQGIIYEAMGRDLRALSSFEAVVRLNPDFHEAIFQKGLIYLRNGSPDQALDDFNYLINGDKTIETRSVYFKIDPSGTTQNQILSMASIESSLYHYRGQAYRKLGYYENAIGDYNQAIQLKADPDFLISRGLLYSLLDSTAQALNDFREALEIDSENQLAWYNIAIIDTSVEIPDRFLEDSEFAPTLSLLASKAMENENYELAKRYFDKSLHIHEDALTYLNRGRAFLKLKKFRSARNDFNKARELDPTRVEAIYLTGNSYFYDKSFKNALAYYDQYLVADPSNGSIWFNAAMSHLELKNYEEACHYLDRALQNDMDQAEALLERYCR